MLDPAPGHVGHMHQTVDAADIHKRAEVSDPANHAMHLGTNHQFAPQLFAAGFRLFQHNGFVGSHDTLAGLVHFDNLEAQRLAYIVADVFHIFGGKLGSGDESTDAFDGGDQAALDHFLTNAFEHLILDIFILHQVVPKLFALNILTGEKHVAFAVVYLEDFHLDLIAHLDGIGGIDIGVGREFAAWDIAIRFIADIDTNFTIDNLKHRTLDDLPIANTNQGLFECFLKAGFGRFFGRRCFRRGGFHSLRCGGLGRHGRLDGSCFLRLYLFQFGAFSHRLFQFAHPCYNLHYYPIRRRRASNNPYYIICINIFKQNFFKIGYRLHMFTVFFAYGSQLLRIRTIMSTNHQYVCAFFT